MINKFALKIGGEAGYGIMTSGYLFSLIAKHHGLSAYGTSEYPSLIRGGHNTFTVRIEEEELTSHLKFVDVLIALDELTINSHIREITNEGALIYDSKINVKKERKDIHYISMPLSDLAASFPGLKKVMMAIVGIGAASGLIGFELPVIKKAVLNIFKKKKKSKKIIEDNLKAISLGFNFIADNYRIDFKNKIKKKPVAKDKILVNGNLAISIGAIAAGCRFISAYPMTPATGIFEYLCQKSKEHKILAFQAEDEISALNMALGASFAGARSMTCTSGGGFALMNETLSLAGSSETPVFIVLAQRPGPATGLPTRTAQGELRYVIHAGHGEFERCVIAPGDVHDCFNLTLLGFNIAERFQIPVIMLTDKYLATSLVTTKEFNASKYAIDRGELLLKPLKDPGALHKFKRYKITESGISPRPVPGVRGGFYCAIGDEHDEEGNIIESPKKRTLMADKRARKLNALKEYLKNSCVEIFGDKNFKTAIVSWGSTKGIILQAMKFLKDANINTKFLQFKILHPFPKEEFLNKLGDFDKLIIIEQNMNSQLGSLIKEHTCLKIDKYILKYDGRPFNPEDIFDEIKEVFA